MKLGMLLIAASMLSVSIARADEIDEEEKDGPARVRIAMYESLLALGIPTVGYYYMLDENVDIDLGWDWHSWHRKLSGDAIRFDTNEFGINAFQHPLFSIVSYHIGRTNNFGMTSSTLLSIANILVWDFIVEYREYPSLNDLIINAVTGVEIGEPLWQIGQLWRGGDVTTGDRLKTALFSPLDALHDALPRSHPRWWRRRAWRSIALEAGGARRQLEDDRAVSEVVLTSDIDLVADRKYVSPGAQAGRVRSGSWSRIRGQIRIGDVDDGTEVSGVRLQSRTVFAGRYRQDDAGNGLFYGLGTAFTYHRDRLATAWDHAAIAQIVGPQVQLSHRTSSLAVRFDVAAYGDFAMIDAHAFGGVNPYPPPPPYINKLQSEGYYDGLGASGTARIRIDSRAWSFDAEVDAHAIWQLSGPDRVQTQELRAATAGISHDASDIRVYSRAQLGYRLGTFGIGANAEATVRHGEWTSTERTTYEHVYGLLAQLAW